MTAKTQDTTMHVLFVEDDLKLLQSLRRMSIAEPRLKADFAEGGEKALDLLDKNEFDIVVADMRMPGMDGATLLNIVQERHPSVARIVLSGQSDRDMVFQVVRPAHQFLSKPCPFEQIMAVLERVYRLKDIFTDRSIRGVISRIDMLPVLPDSYRKLLDELESEDCSMNRVGKVIAADPALTADILKVVNSSFFGLPQAVTTPTKAATYLGTELLRGLVLSANLFSTFDTKRYPRFSVNLLWDHAINTALFCRALSQEEPFDLDGDESFNTGLLHDVGKLILADKFPKEYRQVLALLAANEISTLDAEMEVFGASHAELGAYLLGLWGFPESTVLAVAGHHNPERFAHCKEPLLTVLHVANSLEHELVVIHEGRIRPKTDPAHLKRAGIDQARYDQWRETCLHLLHQDNPVEEQPS